MQTHSWYPCFSFFLVRYVQKVAAVRQVGFCLVAIWKVQLICLQSFCYFCLSNIFLCI